MMADTNITAFQKWMITFTVMLVAIIEVLDITIVNVSLNQMQGAFSATTEQITWILTSYLVSSAIFMTLTGLLIRKLGRRRLLLINIIGFLIASMLCGVSTNLTEIVLFRTLQGIFGASLVPISQFVLRDTFNRKEQGMAMAIWGIGIMTAPVLGPTIGGYITEALNWRFIFYMNLPICVMAFILTLIFIKETPVERNTKIDWFGLLLVAITVGCFQTFLDRGNQEDWFNSTFILTMLAAAFIAGYSYINLNFNRAHSVVNIRLYLERNFTASSLIMLCYCLAIFGVATLQPIMLGSLYHYPPETIGLAMAPRGLASACMMMVCPLLMRKFLPKTLIIIGLLFSAYGTWQLCHLNLNADMWSQIYPGMIQGIGMALVLVPNSSITFDYLPANKIPDASGLFSFARSMGTSIGISIMSTIITRLTQINWSRLAEHTQASNPNLHHWLQVRNLNIHNPLAIKQLAMQVQTQANMIAFLDAYWFAVLIFLAIIPLVFLLKKSKASLTDLVTQ